MTEAVVADTDLPAAKETTPYLLLQAIMFCLLLTLLLPPISYPFPSSWIARKMNSKLTECHLPLNNTEDRKMGGNTGSLS